MVEKEDKPYDSKKKKKPDSSTEVNYRLDEPRKTVGFKCNVKLWKAFVQFSKPNYGSVCHILEPMMIAVLASKVNQSRTITPLIIENLNVARVVKRVRRYEVEEESLEFLEYSSCRFPNCGRKGIHGILRQKNGLREEIKCCKKCFEKWKANPRYEVVRVISDGSMR